MIAVELVFIVAKIIVILSVRLYSLKDAFLKSFL